MDAGASSAPQDVVPGDVGVARGVANGDHGNGPAPLDAGRPAGADRGRGGLADVGDLLPADAAVSENRGNDTDELPPDSDVAR